MAFNAHSSWMILVNDSSAFKLIQMQPKSSHLMLTSGMHFRDCKASAQGICSTDKCEARMKLTNLPLTEALHSSSGLSFSSLVQNFGEDFFSNKSFFTEDSSVCLSSMQVFVQKIPKSFYNQSFCRKFFERLHSLDILGALWCFSLRFAWYSTGTTSLLLWMLFTD